MISSSWIYSIAYRKLPDGSTYIAVFTKGDAMLYGGDKTPIPSYLPGLISAGTGSRSIGHAYHKLLKGKYPYQRIEGTEKVNELKELMKG